MLRAFKARLEAAWQGVAGDSGYGFGHFAQRDTASWSACDVNTTIMHLKVIGARLQ
jgi:hypothetical protein